MTSNISKLGAFLEVMAYNSEPPLYDPEPYKKTVRKKNKGREAQKKDYKKVKKEKQMTKNEIKSMLKDEAPLRKAKITDIHKRDGYYAIKDNMMGKTVTFEPGAFSSTRSAPGYLKGLCRKDGIDLYFFAVKLEPDPLEE